MKTAGGIAVCLLLAGAMLAAQAHSPEVSMTVTLPDGTAKDVVTHESGVAKVTSGGTEYGLRPTMLDDAGARITITIFALSPTAKELGEVEVKAAGPAVTSKTTPAFKIQVSKVSKSPISS